MEKNFKLLLRTKSSALIIILGPLILISLLGLAFSNTQPYALSVATYSPEFNELSNSMLEKLNEQQFTVTKYPSEEACITKVKQAIAHVCLIFPKDFEISQMSSNNITFHVDLSKINLVWNVLEVISQKVASRSTEISEDLTQTLVKSLDFTKGEVSTNLPNLVELSIKTSQLETINADMLRTLHGINLKLDEEGFKVGNLENAVSLYNEKSRKVVSRALDLIDNLEGSYGKFNFTASQQLAVDDVLDTAEEDLLTLEKDLQELYGSGTDTLIGGLLSNLNTKLEDTKAQLAEAANSREIINQNVQHTKALLETNIEKINQLQVALDKINDNIGGIEILDPTKIVSPFTTTIRPVAVDTYFNYLFPTLMVLIIMITGILLGSTLMIVEKKSRAFFRNAITPTHDTTFLTGLFLTSFVLLLFQIIVFLIVAGVFFKANVFATFAVTPVIIFFVITFFILTGMLVGALFKSEETTTLAAISFASVFLFFSSAILPIESMPKILQKIAAYNPFVLSDNMLRQSIIFEFGYGQLIGNLLLLVFYIALFFALLLYAQHAFKVHTLYKIHKQKNIPLEIAELEKKEYPAGWKGSWMKWKEKRQVKKEILRRKRELWLQKQAEKKRQVQQQPVQATQEKSHGFRAWVQNRRARKLQRQAEKQQRSPELPAKHDFWPFQREARKDVQERIDFLKKELMEK